MRADVILYVVIAGLCKVPQVEVGGLWRRGGPLGPKRLKQFRQPQPWPRPHFELNAGGMKRDIDKTNRCTNVNCCKARPSTLCSLWPSDDDDDLPFRRLHDSGYFPRSPTCPCTQTRFSQGDVSPCRKLIIWVPTSSCEIQYKVLREAFKNYLADFFR